MYSLNTSKIATVTQSEIASGTTISTLWNGPIKTDRIYAYTRNPTQFGDNRTFPFDDEIYKKNYLTLNESVVLISNRIIGKIFVLYSSPYRFDHDIRDDFIRVGYSNIYNSGNVRGYFS
jgi:hypothetical protein